MDLARAAFQPILPVLLAENTPYAAPKIVSPRLDPLSACPQKAERAVATLFRGAT